MTQPAASAPTPRSTREGTADALPPPSAYGDAIAHPVMTQRWAELVFVHWRYRPDEVQRLLPPGVSVDVHDGSAWVGLVPFRMERLSLPGLGVVPFLGTFPEVNVRTYVYAGERRGVWFFSLDVNVLLPTLVARAAYRLPYCYGRAHHDRVGDIVTSRVDRRWPRRPAATAEIVVRTGSPAEASELTDFLTNRWGLLSAGVRATLRYAPIDHPPWPLHHAEVLHLDETLVTATGLPAPAGPAHALWSPGVDVRVGLPTRRLHPQ